MDILLSLGDDDIKLLLGIFILSLVAVVDIMASFTFSFANDDEDVGGAVAAVRRKEVFRELFEIDNGC